MAIRRSSLRRRLSAVSMLLVVATVLTAAPVFADRFEHLDAARDMHAVGPPNRLDPNHKNADIRKVLVEHRPHFVTILAHFRDLHPVAGPGGFLGMSGVIDVNPKADAFPSINGSNFSVIIHVTPGRPHEPTMEVTDALGTDELFCIGEADGLVGRVDYVKNTIFIGIPRRCLHQPRWVRMSLFSFATPGESGPVSSWHDVMINPFPRNRFTPRLFRG